MVFFRDRHLAYKVGFAGLLVSIVTYILGFSCPYWAILRLQNYGYVDQTVGLWQACIHGSLTCVSNVHANNPPWINAARALSSIALVLFFIVLFVGCYRNVSRFGQANCNTPGRYVEGLAILAALIGSIGVVIFAAEFHRLYMFHFDVGQLYWAFGVVCSALAVAGVCAMLMFAFHSPKHPRRRGRRTTTLQARGPNGYPVTIQFSTDPEDGWLHIPYFGDVTPDQLEHGAVPVLPPSYEMVTSGLNYPNPPADGSEAPPLYEDVTKDGVPPELVQHMSNAGDKESREEQ
ncbi:hypothetical protein BaRGS_00002758 [Batillaria attramentaria]|uniref:Uncharacterized protein n=1 Tax=Batillaria attramentaria TaxID=370345 RepID=A0ABD0M2R1_9CAEN|nr:hypothetical protein BaRGS_007670 [Batillaria attramentaria]